MKPPQAPEIFQKPIAALDMAGLPSRDAPEFGDALIARYALEYASKGWNAVVTVDDEFVRVVAVPERGMDPKKYVLGLLKDRYLEDALPILEALYGMLDDTDIAYNYGICLSELGKIEESVKPLERSVALDGKCTNAYIGLGVAYTRLGRNEDAERVLHEAIQQDPKNANAFRIPSPSTAWSFSFSASSIRFPLEASLEKAQRTKKEGLLFRYYLTADRCPFCCTAHNSRPLQERCRPTRAIN